MTCTDCNKPLTLTVCESAAGFYIGRWCDCGPYSRESGYYPTREAAGADLPEQMPPPPAFIIVDDGDGDDGDGETPEGYFGPEYDGEPSGPDDLSDDGEALASAGMGTDEDYGCFDSGDDW
jgi:hypothetical protein